MNRKTKACFKLLIIIIGILLLAFSYITIKIYMTRPLAHIKPNYKKISIAEIIDKKSLTGDDYKTLFLQTGLGKTAIDALLNDNETGKDEILKFQDNLFKDIYIKYEMITPITYQESTVDNNGDYTPGTDLAPIENGYILVTRATYSLGWRHGHAAIITDSENRMSLEAAVLGENSQLSNVRKWRYYPNFMILKLKDAPKEKLDAIAKYASDKLYNVPYRLTVGIFSSKYKNNIDPTGTNCSHLVWYPFKKYGIDLDSDYGLIVTPKDIANSPYVEIVQAYGFDLTDLWK